jgi:hypothetical protein
MTTGRAFDRVALTTWNGFFLVGKREMLSVASATDEATSLSRKVPLIRCRCLLWLWDASLRTSLVFAHHLRLDLVLSEEPVSRKQVRSAFAFPTQYDWAPSTMATFR